METAREEKLKRPLKPLRVWPAALLVGLIVLLRLAARLIGDAAPALLMVVFMGPLVCCALILIWWLAASRASGRERWMGLGGILLALFGTGALIHPTMRGPAVMILTIPMGVIGFSVGLFLGRNRLSIQRTVIAIAISVVGFGFSILLRNQGMWGDFANEYRWRWTPSAEEALLANRGSGPGEAVPLTGTNRADQALLNPEWPGFRGPGRDSRQRGVTFSADWVKTPPRELWRIAVGPAWSSFAVAGNVLFTQEQRGPAEAVVCYDADSGRELWIRTVEARIEDPMGGPGPRATPLLAQGRLLVLGAMGDLICLRPGDGSIHWQTNIGRLGKREVPTWGYSSSPLVAGSVVIVYAGGEGDRGTLAFDIETGNLAWSAPAGDQSYSSPHPGTLEGEELVLMQTNRGLQLLDPLTGTVRLNYEWSQREYRSLQPQIVDGNSVLIASSAGAGLRRIRITRSKEGFEAEEVWTTRNLKSDYNDFVIHQDHLYGFDGGLFTCVALADGERRWKGGRYGKGQVLLLEDSGLLLVAGERGEVALLKASPAGHEELANVQMLTGKTWNHPVVVGDRLYLRNAREAACYLLSTAVVAGSAPVGL